MRERSVSVLLVDIGNSQIKWQLLRQDQSLSYSLSLASKRGDWAAFQTWLADIDRDDSDNVNTVSANRGSANIEQVLVASVKQENPLRAALEIIFGQR